MRSKSGLGERDDDLMIDSYEAPPDTLNIKKLDLVPHPPASPSKIRPIQSGNIHDLATRQKMKKPAHRSKNLHDHEYISAFIADIDNFIGVKDISNYYIGSMRDDSFLLGAESVGVLQLYNKKGDITAEDSTRLEFISNFFGALSLKCQEVAMSLTLIIGLTQDVHKSSDVLGGIDSTIGDGIF